MHIMHMATQTLLKSLAPGNTHTTWKKVKPSSQGWLIAAGAYPGFCSMKRLEVFLLPLDGMIVHRRSLPCNFVRFPQQIAGTHIYTWVERGTVRVKCLAQEHNTLSPARARPRPGLEPRPLDPESSALTTRPRRNSPHGRSLENSEMGTGEGRAVQRKIFLKES